MVTIPAKLHCPACQGTRLVLGSPLPFPGFGIFKLLGKTFGYAKYPFACLDCGFVGKCLSESDRRKLEDENRGTYRDV